MAVRSVIGALFACLAALVLTALPAHAQGPAFRVDPYWPKPLPNNWILGQIGGISVDASDNIWVFQRPRSLTDDEKGATLNPPRSKCCVPAPSVLVFNQSGEVVKSWGGPGDNLGYDWPTNEHGILVDNKGFVWLSGNGKTDMMVLKFTTDGKFVAEIGKSGPLTSSTDLSQFGQVAALEYDKTANEIYAADGYGNHRVAVLDGDNGAIKRVWGAYGKPPTDDKLPPYDTAELIPQKGDAAMALKVLTRAGEVLPQIEFKHDPLDQTLRAAALEMGLKAGQMFQPIRVAVCGRKNAPPLFETLEVLGKPTALSRIERAIEKQGAHPLSG